MSPGARWRALSPISNGLLHTSSFFFLNDTPPPKTYPLPLHDALPIPTPPNPAPSTRTRASIARRVYRRPASALIEELFKLRRLSEATCMAPPPSAATSEAPRARNELIDRKSTRLNSSHLVISYAVFCL